MQLVDPPFDGGQLIASSFDDQLPLALPLHGSVPSIDRRHRRADVDARRELLLDEARRDPLGGVRVGNGRQHDDEISSDWLCHIHFRVVLRSGLLYCFPTVGEELATKTPRSRQRMLPAAAPGRSRRFVRLLLVFVACVILVDALVGDRGLVATMRARQQYDGLAGTIARQRAENARLAEEARRLKEDPSAIEEIARRELGLIKPGEKVFIVKDVPQPGQQ